MSSIVKFSDLQGVDIAEVIAELIDDEDVSVLGVPCKILVSHDAEVWGKLCLELVSLEDGGGVTEFSVMIRKTRKVAA